MKQSIPVAGRLKNYYRMLVPKKRKYIYKNPIYTVTKHIQPDFFKNHEHIAIFCVYSNKERAYSFKLIAKCLINIKYLPALVSSIHLFPFKRETLEDNVEKVAKKLTNRILRSRHKNIILIEDSDDSPVCSYFSEHLAKDFGINVVSIVTLGAPPFDDARREIKQHDMSSLKFIDEIHFKIMKHCCEFAQHSLNKTRVS